MRNSTELKTITYESWSNELSLDCAKLQCLKNRFKAECPHGKAHRALYDAVVLRDVVGTISVLCGTSINELLSAFRFIIKAKDTGSTMIFTRAARQKQVQIVSDSMDWAPKPDVLLLDFERTNNASVKPKQTKCEAKTEKCNLAVAQIYSSRQPKPSHAADHLGAREQMTLLQGAPMANREAVTQMAVSSRSIAVLK